MKYFRLISIFVILAMVMSLGYTPTAAQSPQSEPSQPDASKIAPSLLETFKTETNVEFYIIMAEQADVSGAAALKTKEEKGSYVFNLLTETAQRTQKGVIALLEANGAKYRSWYIMNMVSATGSLSTVEALSTRTDVASIVSAPDIHMDPVWKTMSQPAKMEAIEWNITRVGAPDVWSMGFTGEGMVLGDNDTGAEYTHPALVNKYRGNLGGGNFNHNYNWWDAWGGAPSPTPTDYDGHGTHTLGTMVGDDGGSNQIGVAPGAQWIACAGLNLECLEFFLAPTDLNGQNPLPEMAPDAVNNSWYDTSGFDFRPIVQNMNAAGIAVIKSAGNWGSACDTISPPGNVPEIISTAAFGQGDVIADFSSRGPSDDYGQIILKPEVAAPGVNVRSSVPGGGYEGGWSGTSMAAPHSTAMIALLWNAAPCLRGNVPLTKQIMMDTADAVIDAQCGPFVDHPNCVWGWGILDMEEAVTMAMGMCGGQGGLEGEVTSGGNPLSDVTVDAEGTSGYSQSDVTGADGLYSMTVFSDTYTVTATKYGYETIIVPGVEVTADVTVTLDIDMPALEFFTLSGLVREAGSNAPLDATIEFLDAPIDPIMTDPATGAYSVDIAEGTWTLRITAADHAPLTATVVVEGDTVQNFYLSPYCDVFLDDVEDGNIGWTAQAPWGITSSFSHSPTNSWTDSPSGNYQNNLSISLTSPVFDLSEYTGISLAFWQRYALESGYDYAYVEYSADGGSTWTGAGTYNGTNTTWHQETLDLGGLDGSSTALIRFHLTTDVSVTYDGWYVDDIQLIGGGVGCVPATPPTAEFISDSPVTLGQAMNFTNQSTGAPEPTYEWDFGDGVGTSTETDPSYTYLATGSYTVTLTATNGQGSDMVEHVVEVLEPGNIVVDPVVVTMTLGMDEPGYGSVDISNTGLGELNATATETVDWLVVYPLPFTVAPGESVSLDLNFDTAGLSAGTYLADVTITSDDPDTPVITVHVTLYVVYETYLPLVLR